jgi:IS6 family transposase
MTERNLSVNHTTVWRWVQRYAPELDRRVRRELKRTGTSWRVDETYVRVAGRWVYLFRALDSSGATLDFGTGMERLPSDSSIRSWRRRIIPRGSSTWTVIPRTPTR